MKQKLLIFVVLIFVVVVLVGLNAATYVQKEKVPDTEFSPNRSTFNSGTTGTQALYALLSETGRSVTRWQSSLETIASETKNRPSVFVLIGPFRRELSDVENTQLMEWVAAGGTLVLIDRDPSTDIATTTSRWQMSVPPKVDADLYVVDASDQKQMTADVPAVKPLIPSDFSDGVNAVQPSRFAGAIELERLRGANATPSPTAYGYSAEESSPPPPAVDADEEFEEPSDETETGDNLAAFDAPVRHFEISSGNNLLVEAPFSRGRVIILSDPYIVSNGGINLVDNARLAVNIVTSTEGLIAFDEYHHGFGGNNNRFFQYFEGTPVISIFLQLGLVATLVFLSQSRRFARPIPEREPSRLSKLEYVSAMAELQQRTRAYDLAVENIYTDFRRRASSLVGLDNTLASRRELAERIAERTGRNTSEIEQLLFACEDLVRGEPTNKSETLALIEKIRKLEEDLGMKRAGGKTL